MFPPLELVRRIRDGEQPNSPFLMINSRRNGLPAARGPEVIHAGIRMSEFNLRHRGNLSRSAQEKVLRLLGSELEKRFQCEIVQTTLDSSLGFCYPYLRSTEGNLVFSQLLVEDYVPAEAAHEACFRLPYFYKTLHEHSQRVPACVL